MNVTEMPNQKATDEALEDADIERWAPLPGYEDRYEISTHGNFRHNKNKVVRKLCTHNGYLWMSIKTGKKTKTLAVHRRVLMAFDRIAKCQIIKS